MFFFHRGGDFVIGGTREGSAWLFEVLMEFLVVQDGGVFEPDTGDKKQLTEQR